MVRWSENELFEDVSANADSKTWLSEAIAAEEQMALTARLQRQRLSHCSTSGTAPAASSPDVQQCLQQAEQQAEHLLKLSVAIQARCQHYERSIQQLQPGPAQKDMVYRKVDKMTRLKRILLKPPQLPTGQAEQLCAASCISVTARCPMCHQYRVAQPNTSGFSLRGTRQEVHALQRQVGQLQWALQNAVDGATTPPCASDKGHSTCLGKASQDSVTRLQAADQAIRDSIARISMALMQRQL